MITHDEVSDWLNKQHEWVGEAAHLLLTKGNLDAKDIEDLVAVARKPEPKKKTPRTFISLGRGSAASKELRLESIGPVTGIDALNPKKPLSFGGDNLSVVYGINGSGKSGYTRILTKACGKAHSSDLKPNVYADLPLRQECTFDYSIGSEKKQVVWIANSNPVDDLRPVDVFDTECGRLYLEKDTELSYELPELSLFTDLVEACKQVEAGLLAEQRKLVSKLPEMPVRYAGSEAGKVYSTLVSGKVPAKIFDYVTWTATDETSLQGQQDRVKVSNPAEAAKKKREAKAQIEEIRASLEQGVKALGESALDAIRRLKEDAVTKRESALDGAAALGDAAKLDGMGTATWKAMWEAARSYSKAEAYPKNEFPYTDEGARCLLCHQDLDEAAQLRLQGFETFVMGILEKEATAAEKVLDESFAILPACPEAKALATTCQAAGLPESVRTAIESAWAKLEPLLAPLRDGTIPERPPAIDSDVLTLLTKLDESATAAENLANELDADAKSADRVLALGRVAELEGRKWVTDQAVAVQAELDRLKKYSEFEEWKKKTSTKGISRKAGELSQVLITDAYVQRFNDELKELGAGKVQVELVKTGTTLAKSKHGIRLRDTTNQKARITDVLSEGERRIVALAAFIADVTGRNTKAPFVFDDPISSLDQFFEEKVIARLIELSKDRQVLIFTHRLSFLGMIADKRAKNFHCVNIERQPWGTGEPGGVPIYGNGTLGALKKLKDESLAKAKKALINDGYEAYNFHAQKLCSDFRKVIERIVETVFLAGVIQRHSREVHTKNVVKNLLRIGSEDCEFIDELMTEFSKHEHSQSLEAPVALPEPNELEAYLDRVITWHTEFEKRKV